MAETGGAHKPGVQRLRVAEDEDGLRVDRWFRRHFPDLSHGRLEKLLRKGEVRIDGKRAKSNRRLSPGEEVRVPPLGAPAAKPPRSTPAPVSDADAEALRAAVLYRDDGVIAINKPPGLAVQGGSKTGRHLDAMLDALRFDAEERPRLVHRLDRDTSGVLLLGRTAASAAALTKAFRQRETQKLYWAVTAGVPEPAAGRIDLPLAKRGSAGGEKMVICEPGAAGGQKASTLYRVVERAGRQAAWVACAPLTGRTHQLRVHLAGIGTPVLGDGKYGGRAAFLSGLASALHLHARRLVVPRAGGREIDVSAPLPDHMAETFGFFGFDPDAEMAPLDRHD